MRDEGLGPGVVAIPEAAPSAPPTPRLPTPPSSAPSAGGSPPGPFRRPGAKEEGAGYRPTPPTPPARATAGGGGSARSTPPGPVRPPGKKEEGTGAPPPVKPRIDGGGSGHSPPGPVRKPGPKEEQTGGYVAPAATQPTPASPPSVPPVPFRLPGVKEAGTGGYVSPVAAHPPPPASPPSFPPVPLRPPGANEAGTGFLAPGKVQPELLPPPPQAGSTQVADAAESGAYGGSIMLTQHTTRQLEGLSGLGIVPLITHDALEFGHWITHEGAQAIHTAEGVAANAAKLVEQGAKAFIKTELEPYEVEAKFGFRIAKLAEENPATVAWAAATIAMFAPPPLDVALGLLSVAASSDAGFGAFRNREYVEGAVDIAAVITGAGGLAARVAERVADADHVATAARLHVLKKDITNAKADDLPTLSRDQRTALEDIVDNLNSSRRRSAESRARERRADLKTAVIALMGDPRVDPALASNHP